MVGASIEPGQSIRWRSRRRRVLGQEEGGFLRVVGVESVNPDHEALALLELEGDRIEPDELPCRSSTLSAAIVPGGEHRTRRTGSLWRAGGREQLVGLDWGAVAVAPKDDSYRDIDIPGFVARLLARHIARTKTMPCECWTSAERRATSPGSPVAVLDALLKARK
jgi:hypothetical protein